MAWLPGDEGRRGLVDVLAGEVDAGGRLPVSLLRTVGQVGAYAGHHHGGGRSLIYGDYIDGPVSPLFPFGHGLSYTTWSYDDVAVVAGSTTEDMRIDVTLTNTGRPRRRGGGPGVRTRRGGLGRPSPPVAWWPSSGWRPRPARPSGSASRFRPTGLGFHGTDLRFRVEPGEVTFLVGPTSTTVTVTGEVDHPDPNRVPRSPPVRSTTRETDRCTSRSRCGSGTASLPGPRVGPGRSAT